MASMRRSIGRLVLFGIVVAAMLVAIVPAASAVSKTSAVKNIGTIGGVYYQIQAGLTDFDDGSGVTSRVWVYADEIMYYHQAACWAELYNGQMEKVSSYGPVYSGGGSSTLTTPSLKTDNHGTYYGHGSMKAKFSDGVTWSATHDSLFTGSFNHQD